MESPLKKSIFKHKIGHKLTINSPDESYTVEILDIEK
ncbi:MAG: GreA/GreB family elongation factor [Clostridium sp.]|nr:GreA/GreB family elongation factor [Clostridium sp.]MEE0933239.1 GreA/GreB family elongation factor [Clostridium sp.]